LGDLAMVMGTGVGEDMPVPILRFHDRLVTAL